MAKKTETKVEANEETKKSYIQMMQEKIAQRKKDKDDNDKQYESKETDDIAKSLDTFIMNQVKTISVEALSERDSIPFWIDTGCVALNWIISNDFKKGLPGTKAIMLSGESGKGKSLLLDSFLGNNIKMGGASYKFDIEDAGGHEFTSKIVDSELIASKIRLITPKNITKDTKERNRVITIEKLNSVLNGIINYQVSAETKKKLKSICVGIDSVTQLTSVKEIEDNLKEKDKKDLTSTQKIREMFRVITQQLKQANTTIIGLAQLTANIGVMFGPTKVENAKGSGFRYASSLSLQATTDKELTKSVKGGAEIPIGIKMRFKTTKNRVEFKGRDAWVYFYFQSGIDKYGGLLELLAQYGIFKASAKASVYGEYTDTVTFKWTHPDTEVEYKFGFKSDKKCKKDFKKFLQELSEEEQEELLTIWNLQINEVYKDMTADWDESVLLESDEPEDEMFEEEQEEEYEN